MKLSSSTNSILNRFIESSTAGLALICLLLNKHQWLKEFEDWKTRTGNKFLLQFTATVLSCNQNTQPKDFNYLLSFQALDSF